MLNRYFILLSSTLICVHCYTNYLLSIMKSEVPQRYGCYVSLTPGPQTEPARQKFKVAFHSGTARTFMTVGTPPRVVPDPIYDYNKIMQKILFGDKPIDNEEDEYEAMALNHPTNMLADSMAQYPNGKVLRAELFQNSTSVHLPMLELMQKGHCYLKETNDYMQTAVNAFSIFLEGDLDDVLRLPRAYVLRSARTIAMIKVAREKLAATWTIIKGDKSPDQISHKVLQMYRPLFKYLNGREMSRLNLSDPKIVTYIGTHADLDRHQVGVVASAYIKLNPYWSEPRYLNQMNNLLCGVPMTFMRRIPENTYLQLSHQVFYHIRACDPLQRRFYLTMMTKTQALGKSYSWSARDVSRLGLLLSEVEGPDLAAINPEAMSGITAQVMQQIPSASLRHITETQVRYISLRPLNILAKKLKTYQDQLRMFNKGTTAFNNVIAIFVFTLGVNRIKHVLV